jgi:hypothetical protein
MPNAAKGSSLTTRLFLEGIEIDLTEDIDISVNYAVSDIKDISKKKSNYTKSITLPGTANNNKLFSFLFDIKSTGAEQNDVFPLFSASLINLVSGCTITNAFLDGNTFALPLNFNQETTSFHNQVNNTNWYIDVSGSTNGYVVCSYNGVIISCNKMQSGVSRYYFPSGFYLFNDQLNITLQPTFQAYNGNIGYNLDYKRKMRAYVIQDNQVAMSGYAKIISSTSKDGLVSYIIQITSDLGGFIASLANLRLEDLYTNVVPDLVTDPTGQTPKTISLPSPYDHIFSLNTVVDSWIIQAGFPFVYPVIDYGNDDTAGQTMFYTSVLRPAIHAKDYIDLIFANAGYSYDSTFLNSGYFADLIIPYKDGNISIIQTFPVQVTSAAQSGTTTVPNVVIVPANSFYPFTLIIADTNGVYSTTNARYLCEKVGTYNVSTQVTANYTLVPSGAGSNSIVCPQFITFIEYEVFPASGGTVPYAIYEQIYNQPQATVTVSGNQVFVGNNTSDNFLISIPEFPVYVSMAGSFIKVRLASTAPHQTSSTFYLNAVNNTITYAGSATLNIINNQGLAIEPFLSIEYSTFLDNQYLTFQDFVPKSVKQIDYVNSIFKLFNLYPVQDTNIQNHFHIYTRDEYYSNQTTKDWTAKIDLLSDFTVKPIPELDASQLLFSYKPDKDWWNKYYDSLYGNYTYGSLRIQTGYQFANKVKDVLSGLLFGPTVPVQMGPQSWPSEGACEIINGPDFAGYAADESSNIIMASGYFAANGGVSPHSSQLSVPVSNNFSGTKFDKAKVGVHILYWGVEYQIIAVFNDYSFQVGDVNGNPTTLVRPLQIPIVSPTQRRINNNFYATNDGFTYITNSNIIIPAIYDSSDNNQTHKPVKTEMRILHFQYPAEDAAPVYNKFYMQYTPVVIAGTYQYQARNYDAGVRSFTQIPYCSHLDDPIAPTKDLLFAEPIALFFTFPFNAYLPSAFSPKIGTTYPTKNLYSRYWVNTVNEITDKDAKFVDCMLNLSSVDISTLDLSQQIFINGTKYRINEVKDYSPDGSLTAAEFIRVPKAIATTPYPLVFAGFDQVISGFTSGVFAGTATGGDNDGEVIVLTKWTQLSGPSGVTITTPGSLSSTFTGLVSGNTYTFQLLGIDNYGLSATSIMHVFTAGFGPCMPSVLATNNGPFALPSPLATLTGTVSDACPGATITSTIWTQISGATSTMVTPNSVNTAVSGITASGNYTYRLTVTDSLSNVSHSDTILVVNNATTVQIENHITSAGIASQTGISGYVYTSGPTLPFMGAPKVSNGTHTNMVAQNVTIQTSGTIPAGSFHVSYYLNGTLINAVPVITGGSASFTVTALSTDLITFDLST